jgi:DNA-binding CsgD family transcriptional regulator
VSVTVADRPTLPASRGQVPALVGRTGEITLLECFLADVKSDGGTLLLTGPPGIGLTALLDASAGLGAAAGYQVVRPNADQKGCLGDDFNGLRCILRELSELVADPGPAAPDSPAAALDPAVDPIRVATSLLALLRTAASTRPVLLLLDDIHRLDQPSYDVLTLVLARLHGSATAVLATVRRPAGTPAPRLLPAHPVPALGDADARTLLFRHFPALSDGVARRVLTEAEGTPLALRELPAGLTRSQRAGLRPLPAVLPLTDRLLQSWALGLRELPEPTRRLLLLAALDDSGDLARLRRVADPGTLLAVLAPAEQARVLRIGTGAGFSFERPLLRTAVVGLASVEERAQAHRDWAAALADEQQEQNRHRGQVSGRPDESRGPDPELRLSLGLAPVSRLLRQDGLSAAHHHLVAAIERYPGRSDPDDDQLISALVLLGLLTSLSGDPDRWRTCEQAIARLPAPLPQALVPTAALAGLGHGRPGDRSVLERAIAALTPEARWFQVMGTTHLAMFLDRIDECRPILRRWQPDPGADAATDVLGTQVMFHLAQCYLHSGEWQAAEELCSAATGTGKVADPASGMAAGAVGLIQAQLAARRGDAVRARRLSDATAAWAQPRGIDLFTWMSAHVRAMSALAVSDHEQAYRELVTVTAPGTLTLPVGIPVLVSMDLVEAAVRTDRLEEAREHVNALRTARTGELSPRVRLLVSAAEALAAAPAEAGDRFDAAVQQPGAERWPFDLARVQLLFGEQQRRVGHLSRARTLLATARDTFTWMGAAPWIERAAGELRAAGATTTPSPDRPVPEGQLAPAEREIAELAAAGLTNKEIGLRLSLSPRTVGNHLYRIYPRLAISSRAGLRDALTPLRPGR